MRHAVHASILAFNLHPCYDLINNENERIVKMLNITNVNANDLTYHGSIEYNVDKSNHDLTNKEP